MKNKQENIIKKFKLFHLTSYNLPIGNFSYSQGLEYAREKKWVFDKHTFFIWQKKQIDSTLLFVDLPILKRLYNSCRLFNIKKFSYWTNFLLSNRNTNELRQEEIQKGNALFYWISNMYDLNNKYNNNWYKIIEKTYLGGLSWISYIWKISLYDLFLSFSYSWIENSIFAAIKIIPFGQSTAHDLLKKLYKYLSTNLYKSLKIKNKDLGSGITLCFISSACHEFQKNKLFRS